MSGLLPAGAGAAESADVTERAAQLLVRPEQAVLHGLLRGADDLADLTQAHPFVVPHLEGQTLARRQLQEGGIDAVAHLPARQGALGILVGSFVHRLGDAGRRSAALRHAGRRGTLRSRRARAQVIEADVAGDAQDPSLPAAL